MCRRNHPKKLLIAYFVPYHLNKGSSLDYCQIAKNKASNIFDTDNMINQSDSFSLKSDESAFLQIRIALGLTRKQLAEKLGVDSETVGNWENGKNAPWLTVWQIKEMNKLLKQLSLTWDDIPDNVGPPDVPLKQYRRTRQRRQPQPE